jgi:hypothetical protein
MMIPYIDERKKLLALYQQRNAVYDEREKALAPLQAIAEAEERKAKEEHIAAGGKWPISLALDLRDPQKSEEEARQWRALCAKSDPSRQAVIAARKVFDERVDAVNGQIRTIETALGSEVAEDFWSEDGGKPALCAMTGLPMLTSDKMAMSIMLALPETADSTVGRIRRKREPLAES